MQRGKIKGSPVSIQHSSRPSRAGVTKIHSQAHTTPQSGMGTTPRLHVMQCLQVSHAVVVTVDGDVVEGALKTASGQEGFRLLATELEISAMLSDVPNVPRVLAWSPTEDGCAARAILFELFACTLQARIQEARERFKMRDAGRPCASRTLFPMEMITQMLRGLVETLKHAHTRGVFHCDLSSGNILCGEDGRFALSDWGLGQICHGDPCGHSVMGPYGTDGYMVPELNSGAPVPLHHSFDTQPLALVAVDLALGLAPFKARKLHKRGLLADMLPPPLSGLVTASLSRNPSDRPTLGQWTRLLPHGPDTPPLPGPPPPPASPAPPCSNGMPNACTDDIPCSSPTCTRRATTPRCCACFVPSFVRHVDGAAIPGTHACARSACPASRPKSLPQHPAPSRGSDPASPADDVAMPAPCAPGSPARSHPLRCTPAPAENPDLNPFLAMPPTALRVPATPPFVGTTEAPSKQARTPSPAPPLAPTQCPDGGSSLSPPPALRNIRFTDRRATCLHSSRDASGATRRGLVRSTSTALASRCTTIPEVPDAADTPQAPCVAGNADGTVLSSWSAGTAAGSGSCAQGCFDAALLSGPDCVGAAPVLRGQCCGRCGQATAVRWKGTDDSEMTERLLGVCDVCGAAGAAEDGSVSQSGRAAPGRWLPPKLRSRGLLQSLRCALGRVQE